MDRRISLSGRLSMSTSNISSPIAESTQINGSSLHSKFPWGGKVLSPNKSNDSQLQRQVSKVAMSPINRIDSRIYTDTQSKGLASRVVKYHEASSKLSRSLSVGNLYNKPGQFPVVHLKKSEIKLRPQKSNSVSMVRIAPPDKSVFQANTRSSILRSGSVVPSVSLQKPAEHLSRENRPILHPAENDLIPTRSVLDALKEISRKRINSDEPNGNETTKKYCKEQEDTDCSQQVPEIYKNIPNTKRQREVQSSPSSKINSPEQATKKRMYTRNNDILSSLSSSLVLMTPKRKLDEYKQNGGITSINDISTAPNAKQQCNSANYPSLENIDKILIEQITPLPPTPAGDLFKLQEPIKKIPETIASKAVKPKLTLFNKNYDDINKNIGKNIHNDEYSLTGTSFVKPRSNSQVPSGANPLMEKTQKSKLALMLSVLSGELNGEDEIDSTINKKTEQEPKEVVVAQTPSPDLPGIKTPASSATITFATSTTTVSNTIPSVLSNSSISSAPKISLLPEPVKTSDGFSFGLKSSTTTTIPVVAASTTIITMCANEPATCSVADKQNPPTSIIKTAVESTVPTESSTSSTKGVTAVATASIIRLPTNATLQSNNTSSSTTSVSTTSFTNPSISLLQSNKTFSFGHSNTTSTAATPTATTPSLLYQAPSLNYSSSTKNTTKPVLFGPTFNQPTTSNSTASLANVSVINTPCLGVPTTSNAFGPITSTTSFKPATEILFPSNSKVASTFEVTNTITPAFGSVNSAFSSPTKSAFTTSSEAIKPAVNLFEKKSAIGGFSFGNSSKPAEHTSNASSFTFGASSQNPVTTSSSSFPFNAVPITTLAASSAGQFTFGNSNTPKTSFAFASNSSEVKQQSTDTTGPFSFGNLSQPQSTTASLGGGNITEGKPISTSAFSFGGSTQMQQTNAPSSSSVFGVNNVENKQNQFVFGATSPAVIPAAPAKAFSFNRSTSSANPSGGFSFDVASPSSGSKNLFGAANNAATTVALTNSNNFTFGTSSNEQKSTTSIFGSIPSNNLSTTPFGASTTQVKPFAFSNGIVGSNNSAPSSSIFGAETSTCSTAFGSASSSVVRSNSQPFTFASSQQQQPTSNVQSSNQPFSFSTSSSQSQSTASSPFVFSPSAAQQQPDTNKTFNFTPATNSANPPPNPFGGNNSKPAFNFSANLNPVNTFPSNSNNTFAAPATTPVFNVGSGSSVTTSANGERLIRKATRRLNK